jgi:hypothetical protein
MRELWYAVPLEAQHDRGAGIQSLGHFSGQAVSHQRTKNGLKFRAEFFDVLNHVNYLFGQFGAISAEPTPLELGQSGFGFPLAARAPRQIQFALKFYF